jgi:hypothetical protein
MGSKSNYLELKLLDGVLGGSNYTQPTPNVFIALYTTSPDDTSTSAAPSPGVEVTGGSYVRLTVVNNATNFPAASAGAKANGTAFTFVQATADWGTVVAFAVVDVVSGAGNILYWGAITPNKTVQSGDTASFAVGDLDITED